MTKSQRQKKVISELRNGLSYRQAAAKLGVHHRTVQRDAAELYLFTAYSRGAEEFDFNRKGLKVFKAVQAKRKA